MRMENSTRRAILRDGLLSLAIYALPVLLMLATLWFTGQRPWAVEAPPAGRWTDWLSGFNSLGLPLFMLALGVVEFLFGLYDRRWDWNERALDTVCFVVPRFITRPLTAYVGLQLLPAVAPTLQGTFQWVPFGWGVAIIAVGDDLTQYWYHRLHHEIPWLWRFHRTHHSAPYMGMSMASRQNLIYTVLFSQTYVTTVLVYLGLGGPAALVLAIKQVITSTAHSAIPWDKPLYARKSLHWLAWVVERLVSTPATHHAHHADRTDDGVGYYKGNFGNMFFLWDVIFGTALITRQYPKSYGISHYERDEWYAQFLWPLVKSSVPGSELASDGPVVKEDAPRLEPAVAELRPSN